MTHFHRNKSGEVPPDTEENYTAPRQVDEAREAKSLQGRFQPPVRGSGGLRGAGKDIEPGGHFPEDRSNYGRGGYYGYTYDPQSYMERSGPTGSGQRDNYRRLGDHRWSGKPWEAERPSRPGYRGLQERLQSSGQHAGKGPRSYRRPDERILEDINDRLYDDPYVNASNVEVEVRGGEVILKGTVEDRQAKRRVEDIGESVSGVLHIENRLRLTTLSSEGSDHPPAEKR